MPNSSPSSFHLLRTVALICALFGIAIPWWWQWFPAIGEKTVLGAPLWFVTSVVGSLVISIVTSRLLVTAWAALEQEDIDDE